MLIFAALIAGCTGAHARKVVDEEVYPLVKDAQLSVFGEYDDAFTIDDQLDTFTQQVLSGAGYSTDLLTTSGMTISLEQALKLAIVNNWTYRSRKEDVYLSALLVTEAQHDFSPIFSGVIAANLAREPSTDGSVERFGQIASGLSVSKLFASGARITVGLSENLTRFYTGPRKGDQATGNVTASLVQPLLNGAGSLVVEEKLWQSERNLIYSVRDFARYQRGFILDRLRDYYRLLQAQNEVDNEYMSYQRLIVARERAAAMEKAERLPQFEVDQALQEEISAKNRWVTAQTAYSLQLGSFKLNLGLPTDLNIQPDRDELDRLLENGLIAIQYDLDAAQVRAEAERLDLLNTRDQIEDADRLIRVAENALLAKVDIIAEAGIQSERNQPLDMSWDMRSYGVGLDIGLPLDRKLERDDVRRAQIIFERSKRDAEEKRNDIILQVRDAYQTASTALQSFEIQQAGLTLAERRVDSVQMLMDAGRSVTIRDQLDAESSLRDARSQLISALIDYTLARLSFYHAIEALEVDEIEEKGAEYDASPIS